MVGPAYGSKLRRRSDVSETGSQGQCSAKESGCIILGDPKESEMFPMTANAESIVIIQPRYHSGMYYAGRGLLVQPNTA